MEGSASAAAPQRAARRAFRLVQRPNRANRHSPPARGRPSDAPARWNSAARGFIIRRAVTFFNLHLTSTVLPSSVESFYLFELFERCFRLLFDRCFDEVKACGVHYGFTVVFAKFNQRSRRADNGSAMNCFAAPVRITDHHSNNLPHCQERSRITRRFFFSRCHALFPFAFVVFPWRPRPHCSSALGQRPTHSVSRLARIPYGTP